MPDPIFVGSDTRLCLAHIEPVAAGAALGKVVVGLCVTTTAIVELGSVVVIALLCVAEGVVVTATVFVEVGVTVTTTGVVDCAKMTLHELLITAQGGALVPHVLNSQATPLVNAAQAAEAIVLILVGAVITSSAMETAFLPPETMACQSDSTRCGIVLTRETREL